MSEIFIFNKKTKSGTQYDFTHYNTQGMGKGSA
jgi:hypothetical protein